MIINAEEALDAIEGADFLYCVLIPLGVGLLLGSISTEVEEGEARVEEVGHFPLTCGAAASGGFVVASNLAAAASGGSSLRGGLGLLWSSLKQGPYRRRQRLPRGAGWPLRAVLGIAGNSWLPRLPRSAARPQNLRRPSNNLASRDILASRFFG